MAVMMDHGALTDLLLAHLVAELGSTSTDPGVGDGEKPPECGWLDGQPGFDAFRPYVVLVSAGAVPRALGIDGPLPTWAVNWSLRSFGGSRAQCDQMATAARQAVAGFTHTKFGDVPRWVVAGTEWPALGPVTRVDATKPAFWQVFDTVTLLCTS
jgi:hypothetical protein